MPKPPTLLTDVERFKDGRVLRQSDIVAVEEPLQMVVEHGETHTRSETPLAVTMRTPGADRDLVLGFLYSEGVINAPSDVIGVRQCRRAQNPHNTIRVALRSSVSLARHLTERRFSISSACGVCGERTIESLFKQGCARLSESVASVDAGAIARALRELESAQVGFRHTGGMHAAALFHNSGALVAVREDVGRHNALDKLIGASLELDVVPSECFVVVSSRASFELVQKSVRTGFPVLVAIGAASSLAIETARRFRMTLVGFAREDRLNVYSVGGRISRESNDSIVVNLIAEAG